MAVLHWIGVFLLFISSVLLLITTISAPAINNIGLLRVSFQGSDQSINFGTFGFCILSPGSDVCPKSHIGYNPASVMQNAGVAIESSLVSNTTAGLTRVFVLHAIACGIAFIAFLCSLGSGVVGGLAGALVAGLAWILTLVSVAVDFTVFGVIHHRVNDDDEYQQIGASAKFGVAIWTLVAALITLFIGMVIVFFTCCSARREKKRSHRVEKETTYVEHTPYRRKKKFGIF